VTNTLLQELLVALLVAACAAFSAWRLMSVRLRLRTLDALERLPHALTAPWLARLRARARAQLAGGCAGCSAGGVATPDASDRSQTPGALRR
jgi:hypothetical protein